jgi:hypothetical protein
MNGRKIEAGIIKAMLTRGKEPAKRVKYTGCGLFGNVIASVSQRSNPFKIKRLLRQKTPRNDCNFNPK